MYANFVVQYRLKFPAESTFSKGETLVRFFLH